MWVAQQGGGTVLSLQSVTNAAGLSEAKWTLGPTAGLNVLEARHAEDSAVVFQTQGEAFKVDLLDSNYGLACGLTQGDLWCWGQDSWVSSPPVSEGPSNPFGLTALAPGLVSQGQGFTELAVGFSSVCAMDGNRTVHCFGPLGMSVTPLPAVPAMRHIAGGDGYDFCGLSEADSTAWCWNVATAAAAAVPSSPAFVDLEMDNLGSLTACGRLVDLTASCWGAGPLGNGSFTSSATPVAVSGGLKFAELAVGRDFSCGRKADGDVWCWGRNADRQLGIAGPDSPVPVLAATQVSRIAAAIYTVIAIRLGSVVRWGYFGNGVGNPLTTLTSLSGLPVVDFAANDISCARLVDGQAYCFNEIFFNTSTIDIDDYSPIQPVP
jgi:hypothetical protein